MGRWVRKIISFYIVLVFLSIPLMGFAVGDGGVFGKSYTVFFIKENDQYAVIDYQSGIQKMFISINFDWQQSGSTAWILPVPGDPENVTVDIPGGVPEIGGDEVFNNAKESIERERDMFLFSYLIGIPLVGYLWVSQFSTGSGGGGVNVYEHIEKFGLTAEVISATEGIGIYNYLTNKSLDISKNTISQLDYYVDLEYSFIVVWISESELEIRYPGIIVEFPTKKIFYPMKLTSIYDKEIIPVNVLITKHMTPKLYKEIKEDSTVEYYHNGEIYIESYNEHGIIENSLVRFVRNIEKHWGGDFTSLVIYAPAKQYTEDIWIEDKKPDNIDYAKGINYAFPAYSCSVITLIFIFILSIILSLLLGPLIIKKDKNEYGIYIILGLCNFFSLIFFVIMTIYAMMTKKYPGIKIIIFILSFITAYALLGWLFYSILLIPLW